MFELVKDAKEKYDIEAVTSGAIASTYQRTRVESICARLSLVSFAYLWNRDQIDLLAEMAESGINSILIKISGIGLTIEKHLGGNLQHVTPDLIKFHRKFGINPCGEGISFVSLPSCDQCSLYLRSYAGVAVWQSTKLYCFKSALQKYKCLICNVAKYGTRY